MEQISQGNLTIFRRKSSVFSNSDARIIIDGVEQGTVLGGEVISLDVESGEHTIRVTLPSGIGTYNVKFVLNGNGILEIEDSTANWYVYVSFLAVTKIWAGAYTEDILLPVAIGCTILVLLLYLIYFRVSYFRIKPIAT